MIKTSRCPFGERILPFDRDAASFYASVVARARSRGTAVAVADGQIAAIAITHGVTVATRDTAPWVPVIDPWTATA